MPLRIHFTPADLRRTVVAPGPDPLWETVLSMHVLQTRLPITAHVRWQRDARERLVETGTKSDVKMLATLVAARGDFPDFLTPHATKEPTAGIDQVRRTPVERLRRDIAAAFRGRQLTPWVRRLAAGFGGERRALAMALSRYYSTLIAPYVDVIETAVYVDRALRARHTLSGGVDGLLGALPALIRWQPPILFAAYPCDRDIYLSGRGLRLIPSYFCTTTPVTLIDPELPPVLVYPASRDQHSAEAPASLVALLGKTRSGILSSLAIPGTTSELARRTGTSAGSASKHAAVLRESGLVVSTRLGKAVVHTLTPMGRALLNSTETGGTNPLR